MWTQVVFQFGKPKHSAQEEGGKICNSFENV